MTNAKSYPISSPTKIMHIIIYTGPISEYQSNTIVQPKVLFDQPLTVSNISDLDPFSNKGK